MLKKNGFLNPLYAAPKPKSVAYAAPASDSPLLTKQRTHTEARLWSKMLCRVRASRSYGHALPFSVVAILALGLSGCAILPAVPGSAREQLEFMSNAMAATPGAREALWQSLRSSGGNSERTELHAALLQSIPDHSGYDPVAARKRLKTFLAQNPSPELASVARMRLADLDATASCRDEVLALRKRMTQVVDIERRQDQQRPKQ